MLYLCLSGSRLAYLNDILTVLHCPEETHYKLKIPSRVVMEPKKRLEDIDDKTVLILYAYDDKTAPDETRQESTIKQALPLRYGKLIQLEEEDNQVYYTIKLGNYCNYKEAKNSPQEFWNELMTEFQDKLLHGIKDVKRSGFLAFFDNSSNINDKIERTESSWIKTVTVLGKCIPTYFKNPSIANLDDNENVTLFNTINNKSKSSTNLLDNAKRLELVFTKLQLLDKANDIQGETIKWHEGHRYKVRVSFYMPYYNDDPMRYIELNLNDLNGVLKIQRTTNNMLCKQGIIDFYCKPESKLSVEELLRISIKDEGNILSNLYYTKSALRVDVKTSKILKIILIALILSISTTIPDIMDQFIMSGIFKLGVISFAVTSGQRVVAKYCCNLIASVTTAVLVLLVGKTKLS